MLSSMKFGIQVRVKSLTGIYQKCDEALSSLNPRMDFWAVKQSEYLLSKATLWELASHMKTKQKSQRIK